MLRKAHLYCALVLMAFLIMYMVSGVLMQDQELGSATEPQSTTSWQALPGPGDHDLEDYSEMIREALEIHAQTKEYRRVETGKILLSYRSPRAEYRVSIYPDQGKAKLTTQLYAPFRTMVTFHRLHGYGVGWLYNIYALLMDLTGLALIFFSISGIYLWLKLSRNKWPGIILLSVALVYTISVITCLLNS